SHRTYSKPRSSSHKLPLRCLLILGHVCRWAWRIAFRCDARYRKSSGYGLGKSLSFQVNSRGEMDEHAIILHQAPVFLWKCFHLLHLLTFEAKSLFAPIVV